MAWLDKILQYVLSSHSIGIDGWYNNSPFLLESRDQLSEGQEW